MQGYLTNPVTTNPGTLTLLDSSYSNFPSETFLASAGSATLEHYLNAISRDADKLEAARDAILDALAARRA